MTASIRLTTRPLSYRAAIAELEGPGLGGVVLFAGRVRPDSGPGGRVVALDYDVHRAPALATLERLAARAARRYGAGRIVLWHRVGRVEADEVSVIVGAACGHRAEAFEAARFLIDELKATVPIWKVERARPVRRPRRPRRPGPGRATG